MCQIITQGSSNILKSQNEVILQFSTRKKHYFDSYTKCFMTAVQHLDFSVQISFSPFSTAKVAVITAIINKIKLTDGSA